MLKVNCAGCSAPYEVDPRRIPKGGMKMRCPACDTTFVVTPQGVAPAPPVRPDPPAEPPEPPPDDNDPFGAEMPTLGGLDLDLPSPTSRAAYAGQDMFADLPAPRSPGGPNKPPDEELELDLDLPAPKRPRSPGPPPKRAAQQFPDDLELDLPAPRQPQAPPRARADDLDLPAPKGKPAADPGADLPAPRSPGKLAPDFDGVDLPAPRSPGKLAPDFDGVDLPAPRSPGKPAPDSQRNEPRSPGKRAPDFDGVDLPAPKSPGKLAPDFDGVDLPAPRSPGKPAHERAPAAPPRPGGGGAGGSPMKSFSRPGMQRSGRPEAATERGNRPVQPGRSLGGIPRDSLAMDPEPFRGAAPDPFGGLDEPTGTRQGPGQGPAEERPAPRRVPDTDLPTVKGGPVPAPSGVTDLPARKGAVDLPGLRGHTDLPAPRRGPGSAADDAGVDLPAPRDGGVDLPAPRDGGVDLPQAKDGTNLPVAKGGRRESLEERLRAAGALPGDEPPPKASPPPVPEAPKGKLPKDSLDIDSFKAMGGELPSPFDLDEASAPHQGLPGPQGRRTSADLSQGLNLPSSATGAREIEDPPPAPRQEPGDTDLASLFDEPDEDAGSPAPLDLDLSDDPGGAPPSLDFDPPRGAPAAGDLDDLLGSGAAGDDPFADAGAADDDPFGLAAPPAAPSGRSHEPIDLLGDDDPLSLDSPHAPPSGSSSGGGAGFGEIDLVGEEPGGLGLDAAAPAEADIRLDHGPQTARRKPRELGMTLDLDEPQTVAAAKAGKGGVPGWVWLLLAVVVFVGTGVGLGQTPYGLFGVYLIERMLPEAGDPKVVAEEIAAAEKRAASDTYVDVRTSLRMLSDARMAAGLSHALLSRSLLHEGLFRLRFGPEASSTQRSVAITSRLRERSSDAPIFPLAQAADLAARGKLAEAKAKLDEAHTDDDPYDGLVRGEIALREGQPKRAIAAFERAAKLGAGARASYGLARARTLAGDQAGAVAALEQTLKLSPMHAGARVGRGEHALAEDRLDDAEQDLLQATGWREVNGERIHGSQADRAEAWTLLGRLYERRGHVSRALAAYDRALEADSLVMEALLGSGRTMLQMSRPREALSRFQSALEAKPGLEPDAEGRIPAAEASVGAAQALLRLDDADEAIARLKAVPASLAQDAAVNLWLGHAHAQKDEAAAAEKYFRTAIEQAPSRFAGYLALAQMLFEEKRPEEAAKTLEVARSKVEDGADVRRMLGQSELTRNHIEAARQQFQTALEFEPDNAGALYGLAVTQRREGNLEQAMATLDRVEQADPKFPALALERGRIHEANGEHEKAVEVYQKALEQREGDLDLQLRLGAALVASGELDRAESLLRTVLKVRPSSAEAEHFIGRVVFARRDSAQAVVHFERAVNLDVTNAAYHMYLAWASLDAGNFAAALESIEKSIERDHTLGEAHWIKGRVQLRMGAVRDAIDSFREALKLSPGRTEAYADMGDAYEQLRKLRSAVASYEAAVERDPSQGYWWYRLGALRLDRGKRDEAMPALSEAVVLGDRMESKPGWLADAHRIYADALEREHRNERALEHYRLYLELAPSDAMDRASVKKAIEKLRR